MLPPFKNISGSNSVILTGISSSIINLSVEASACVVTVSGEMIFSPDVVVVAEIVVGELSAVPLEGGGELPADGGLED